MKHKNNITDENYEEVVLRRAINICWILLAICFVVKIFGGNFFDIICNNEKFVEFCSYVDNHLWIQMLIGCISSYITYSLYWLAICGKRFFGKKEVIFIAIIIPICVVLRILNAYVALVLDVVQYFLVPYIFIRSSKTKLNNWLTRRIIFGFILNLSFQLISLITKNQAIKHLTDNFLVAIIFAIDVYIMLALYYLYSNTKKQRRRNTKMGLFLNWLFGKTEAQLRNMKATRLAKIEKLQEEVKAIDEEMNKKNEG